MEIEGKTLKPAEWRLYCCRRDTPRQRDHDCGLYAIMFAMCLSKRLPLSLITRRRVKASRVILLCHIIGLQPERARPLGAMNEFIPKRFRSPDTPSKELDSEAVLDLTSTPPKTNGRGNQSNDSVLDLISPDKNPRKGTDEAVTDRVTSPTNLKLKFSENDSGEGGTGASKDTAPNAGERQDNQDDTPKTTESASANSGDGTGNTGTGSNAASGGGGDDEGNGRDDGDKKDGSTGSGKEDEDSGDTSDEEAQEDGKDVTEDKTNVSDKDKTQDFPAAVSGIILPFVDFTGIAKKNHELYNKAVEVDEKKSNKASRLNLKKRKDRLKKERNWT
jgi:hypothetical protein